MQSRTPSIIDLNAELAKLTMVRRTPQSTMADRKGSVARLASYRDGLLLAIKFSGKDHWESHPGDELIHILDGTAILEIVCDDGPPKSFVLRAGMMAVIPQGGVAPLSLFGGRDANGRDALSWRAYRARCRRPADSRAPGCKGLRVRPHFVGTKEIEGRRKAPFFFASLGAVPQLAMGFEGSWRLSEPRGRRRYVKVLVLQESFHSRYALRIVALLAIKTRGYSSVIAGAIGILAATCAIAIEI